MNLLLFFVIMGLILVLIFFWFFNKRSKARNKLHLHRLQSMLDICQGITASIPTDAQTEEDITDAILTAIRPGLKNYSEQKIYILRIERWPSHSA